MYKLAKQINEFTGVPILKRDFKWYYTASHTNMLNTSMKDVYDTVLNNDVYRDINDGGDDVKVMTNGLKEVSEHVDKYGISTEKTKYMYDLAVVDNWLYNSYLQHKPMCFEM